MDELHEGEELLGGEVGLGTGIEGLEDAGLLVEVEVETGVHGGHVVEGLAEAAVADLTLLRYGLDVVVYLHRIIYIYHWSTSLSFRDIDVSSFMYSSNFSFMSAM